MGSVAGRRRCIHTPAREPMTHLADEVVGGAAASRHHHHRSIRIAAHSLLSRRVADAARKRRSSSPWAPAQGLLPSAPPSHTRSDRRRRIEWRRRRWVEGVVWARKGRSARGASTVCARGGRAGEWGRMIGRGAGEWEQVAGTGRGDDWWTRAVEGRRAATSTIRARGDGAGTAAHSNQPTLTSNCRPRRRRRRQQHPPPHRPAQPRTCRRRLPPPPSPRPQWAAQTGPMRRSR